MELQFDTRTVCYIALVGILVSIIACLCCALCACAFWYLSSKNGLCFGKSKGDTDDCYHSFAASSSAPFFVPQNCMPAATEDASQQLYSCVGSAGLAGKTLKKGKVNL